MRKCLILCTWMRAHNRLDWTPLGGYPYLGYLARFGACTIYHAGLQRRCRDMG